MQESIASLKTLYATRTAQFLELEQRLEGRCRALAWWRAVTFLAGLAAFGIAWSDWERVGLWLTAAGILLVAFYVLVRLYDRADQQRRREHGLRRINEHGLARLERRWNDLPLVAVEVPPQHAATGVDLDLFGRISIFQLLCHAYTPAGVRRLRDWLLEPGTPSEIAGRQAAAESLAPQLAWRQELMLAGRPLVGTEAHLASWLDWATGPVWLLPRTGLRRLALLLPLVALVLLVLAGAGLVPYSLWIGMLLVNLAVGAVAARPIHEIFTRVSTQESEVEQYIRLFAIAESLPGDSPLIVRLRGELASDGGARRRLELLQRIVALANFRYSPFIHSLLQALTLWDVHVMAALERWQQQHGRHLLSWIEALAELEAVASLAALAHDHPSWTWPRIAQDATAEPHFRARGLGHPLIAEDRRVTNDIEIGPPGTFLLVTGSNMSGKSTMLRSVGVNVALAQAGAPVCAEELAMSSLELATSMRVSDSLAEGVSFFMAELKRLKQIVDRAHQLSENPERTLLYLLDEILQGTNSRERHIAVVRVLDHLLQQRAIGAISTHDLELGGPPLDRSSRPVHFREHLREMDGRQQMEFDYRMRPGIAPTTNALKLLEMIGLGEAATT